MNKGVSFCVDQISRVTSKITFTKKVQPYHC